MVRGYTDRIDGAELKIADAVRPGSDKSAVEHVFFHFLACSKTDNIDTMRERLMLACDQSKDIPL